MGAFYGSIHVRTEKFETVQSVLEQVAKASGKKFLLGPALNGWTSFYPEHGGQDSDVSADVAKLLAEDIFHLIVHDDDQFLYFFYRRGQLVDQYNSSPDYFGEVSQEEKQQSIGRPELFQDLLPDAKSLTKLKALLNREDEGYFTFETERMEQFVEVLGLRNAMSNYDYLQAGDRDGITGWKKFIHIPDLQPEKAAKKAAKARLAAEKERLKAEGLLLAEIKPLSKKANGAMTNISWGIDSTTNGILLLSQAFHLTRPIDDPENMVDLLTLPAPWDTPLLPTGLKASSLATSFCMSRSGKWLAGGFAFGDWKLRLWDWHRKELAFDVPHTQAVSWVGFSADEQLIYSLSGQEFIVTSIVEKRTVMLIKIGGGRQAAVHPAGKFAALAHPGLQIIDLETEKVVKKLHINRGMKKMDRWPNDSEKQAFKHFFTDMKFMKKMGLETGEQLQAWMGANRYISFPSEEQAFDVQFDLAGEKLFLATSSGGIRAYDWNQLLAATEDAPAPQFSVDAPVDDENDPNSHPLAYCVRFDAERDMVISSCLAGVIQYLSVKDGRSGTLLKLPDAVGIWRIELTNDGKALCCHCSTRPKMERLNERSTFLQVWNYQALWEAVGKGEVGI